MKEIDTNCSSITRLIMLSDALEINTNSSSYGKMDIFIFLCAIAIYGNYYGFTFSVPMHLVNFSIPFFCSISNGDAYVVVG